MKTNKKTNETKKREGSPQLNREVRAAFILRNDSLKQWCLRNGFKPSITYRALNGERGGPHAMRIISAAKEELGIK